MVEHFIQSDIIKVCCQLDATAEHDLQFFKYHSNILIEMIKLVCLVQKLLARQRFLGRKFEI